MSWIFLLGVQSTGSPCLMTVSWNHSKFDGLPQSYLTDFQSSIVAIFPIIPWSHFGLLPISLHLQLFAVSHGHLTIIFGIFPSLWFPISSKEVQWRKLTCLTTTVLTIRQQQKRSYNQVVRPLNGHHWLPDFMIFLCCPAPHAHMHVQQEFCICSKQVLGKHSCCAGPDSKLSRRING